MSAEQSLTVPEQIEIVRRHFMEESSVLHEAGVLLRQTLEPSDRDKLVGERVLRFARCEALVEAYLDLREAA